MRIDTTKKAGQITVVELEGEFDGSDSESFISGVTDLFTGPGVKVVVDLSRVSFINSVGLGDLVRITAQANLSECRVLLAGATPRVAGVIHITQLDKFLNLTPDLDTAVKRLG